MPNTPDPFEEGSNEPTGLKSRLRFSVSTLMFLTAVAALPIAAASYFFAALQGNGLSTTGFMVITLGAPLGFMAVAAGLLRLFGFFESSGSDSKGKRKYLG